MATAQEKATYTHGHHSSVVNSHARRTAQDSAAFLLPHLKPHHTILDIGCGPGTITADLAELVPEGKVTGVDAVEAVLERARAHVAGRSGITNCTFEVADANALPYPDDSFDVVFCHQVLQHVQNPVGILKEMQRVAKPGGIVAAREADYKSFAWFPEPQGLDEWLDAYRKTARLCGGQPDAGRYVRQVRRPRPIFFFFLFRKSSADSICDSGRGRLDTKWMTSICRPVSAPGTTQEWPPRRLARAGRTEP